MASALEKRVAWRIDWDESESGWGIRPDGASLHSSKEEADKCIARHSARQKEDYRKTGKVPHEYDRPGRPFKVLVMEKKIFDEIKEKGSVRYWRGGVPKTAKPLFNVAQ